MPFKKGEIAIYENYTFEESLEITRHHRIIQSMVDTYNFKSQKSEFHIIDKWGYKYLIASEDGKIYLLSRKRMGDDIYEL